jgi:hypothetical protein
VLAALGVDMRGLAGQQVGRGMDGLATLLQPLRQRRLGQPVDLHPRPRRAQGPGDRDVPAGVAEADR